MKAIPARSLLSCLGEKRVHRNHRASRRGRILGVLPRSSRREWSRRNCGRGGRGPRSRHRTYARCGSRGTLSRCVATVAASRRQRRLKRTALLIHLTANSCVLLREGASHSVWTNLVTGERESVPRHSEVKDGLARKICDALSIPRLRGEAADHSLSRITDSTAGIIDRAISGPRRAAII
jgi:mRNA interferase HicA